MICLSLQPVTVATGGRDETGVLVLADGRLVAVLTKLEDAFYDEACGSWHLEAGFGACAKPAPTFRRLVYALGWVADRLDVGESFRLGGLD